jgi:homoserine kinase type II
LGVFTKLTLEEINELIKDTNIVFISLQETQNGVTDSTYIGTSQDGTRYIFKVLENSTLEDIKNEIYILNTIKELKVPKVLSKKIVMYQDKPTILFSFIEGKIPKQINIKKVEELAKFMAKLHNIKNIEPNNENIYTLEFMKKMLKKVDDENLKQLLQTKFDVIKDINLPNNSLIHGDLFPDNAKFLDDSLSGVYDFAQSCYGNSYFDFAVFIVSWCFEEYSFESSFLQKAMENYDKNLDIKTIKPYLLYACLYYTLQRANRKNPKKDYNEFLRKFDILKELL